MLWEPPALAGHGAHSRYRSTWRGNRTFGGKRPGVTLPEPLPPPSRLRRFLEENARFALPGGNWRRTTSTFMLSMARLELLTRTEASYKRISHADEKSFLPAVLRPDLEVAEAESQLLRRAGAADRSGCAKRAQLEHANRHPDWERLRRKLSISGSGVDQAAAPGASSGFHRNCWSAARTSAGAEAPCRSG